jgi:phenylacetate-CoA ligase
VNAGREHYDELEVRSPSARQIAEADKLAQQIAYAKANAAYYRELLADVDPASVTTREALARLPITRKSDLREIQAKAPPFGGLNGWNLSHVAHVFSRQG